MKKTAILLIAALMMLSLAGCGENSTEMYSGANEDLSQSEAYVTADPAAEAAEEAAAEEAAAQEAQAENVPEGEAAVQDPNVPADNTAADNTVVNNAQENSTPANNTASAPAAKTQAPKKTTNNSSAQTQAQSQPAQAQPQQQTQPAPAAPAPAAAPYSQKTGDTVLTITGNATDRAWYFTLSDIQNLGGTVSDNYFSLGKDPVESTDHYTGISVQYLIEQVMGITNYKKVNFTATDGYSGSYSRSAVNKAYYNELTKSNTLHMILAWDENGAPCTFRLVMGQQVSGEYNRTFWVQNVNSVEVKM